MAERPGLKPAFCGLCAWCIFSMLHRRQPCNRFANHPLTKSFRQTRARSTYEFVSCAGHRPQKGGYTMPAPVLDPETSHRGDFTFQTKIWHAFSKHSLFFSSPMASGVLLHKSRPGCVKGLGPLVVRYNPIKGSGDGGPPCLKTGPLLFIRWTFKSSARKDEVGRHAGDNLIREIE